MSMAINSIREQNTLLKAMSTVKTEAEDQCPPGMTFDKDEGKCLEGMSSSEKSKNEETNAGTSADVGTKTIEAPAPEEIPSTDHKCPDGQTWNDSIGTCEATGDNAGKSGGGGTGAPDVPGKETVELLTKTMASHSSFTQGLLEKFATISKENIEALMNRMGLPTYSKESAAFGNVKRESLSSDVDQSAFGSVYKESVETPAMYFGALAQNSRGQNVENNELLNMPMVSWKVNPTAYFDSLPKGYINHSLPNTSHTPVSDGMKSEGFDITGGDMPQIFSKLVYLIPGGRMKVPIRQFLDTQIVETADRYNWYTVNGVDFAELPDGTTITAATQTISKETAEPKTFRSFQVAIYSDIENAPFDLIEAYNRAVALSALDTESTVVLDTLMQTELLTTDNSVTNFGWVNGNTGGLLTTSDNVVGVTTMTQEGLYAAKRQIDVKGGDSSPGNLVFFAHPKPIEELVLDTTNEFFTGSPPVGAPLHSTALGILENRLGVDIVMNNRVAAETAAGSPNVDTYRNILMVKGIVGLAVAADVQIEAQRRPDLAAVNIGARMRIAGAIIDRSMIVRISTVQ